MGSLPRAGAERALPRQPPTRCGSRRGSPWTRAGRTGRRPSARYARWCTTRTRRPISGVHKYPERQPQRLRSTSSDEHAELTMGSGKRHFRNVGILQARRRAEVIQVPSATARTPSGRCGRRRCDGWATGPLLADQAARARGHARGAHPERRPRDRPRSARRHDRQRCCRCTRCTDGAVIMGLTSAMFSFQRAHGGAQPARQRPQPRVRRRATRPTDPDARRLACTTAPRQARHPRRAASTDADDQYCDDAIRALINDLVTLHPADVQAPSRDLRRSGDEAKRGDVKMCNLRHRSSRLDLHMTMADTKKDLHHGRLHGGAGRRGLARPRRSSGTRCASGLSSSRPRSASVLNGPSHARPQGQALMTAAPQGAVDAPDGARALAMPLWRRAGRCWTRQDRTAPSGRVTLSTALRGGPGGGHRRSLTDAGHRAAPAHPRAPTSPSSTPSRTWWARRTRRRRTGAGGWMLIEGDLHGFSVRWPMWLGGGTAGEAGTPSPRLELWAASWPTLVILHRAPQRRCVHQLPHRSSPTTSRRRAAANRGRSHAATMHIDRAGGRAEWRAGTT